jgi:hypothetical protein
VVGAASGLSLVFAEFTPALRREQVSLPDVALPRRGGRYGTALGVVPTVTFTSYVMVAPMQEAGAPCLTVITTR